MFLTELFNAFIKSISAVVHLVEYILDVYLRRLHSGELVSAPQRVAHLAVVTPDAEEA